jgi:hypothetical protein
VNQGIFVSEIVKRNNYPPNWVVLPGSSLMAELVTREWTKKPVIEICGNREGFVSLGNLLLWISLQSDTESLLITGLPFVHAKSALSLAVVQPMSGSDSHGKLVRTDKDQQFQWLIKDSLLERQAISIIDLGLSAWFYPDGNHSHGNVGPDSEYELFFATEGDT